jgi:transcriptional regulator with XRE-family HTH domain
MRKRRLGEELRKLRSAAGISTADVADELGCSEGKVRHIEGGRNAPSKPDLTVMVSLYGVGPEVHAALEEMRREAGNKGWWAQYRLPTWLQSYVGLENDASNVKAFALELLPGLAQIEAYARAVHVAGAHMTKEEDVKRWVSARLQRQARLLDDQYPLELHAVISEAALSRVRGTEFAAEQCRHLVALAERDNVTIQVLPFSATLHPSMSGSFVTLEFDPGVSNPVAYLEYAVGGTLVDDQDVVARLNGLFDRLAAGALSAEDSVRYIAEWI